MKATDALLLGFINKSPQFIIPIYQRPYSWTEDECRQLFDDILRVGSSDHLHVHFMGSIVYIEDGISNNSSRAPQLVIDGQQRLTSVLLLLAALARQVGDDEPCDGFSRKKINNRYLLDPDEDGLKAFKLLLSKTDKNSLNAIVKGTELPDDVSVRISENFRYFARRLSKGEEIVRNICAGLNKLMIVDVALSREQDDPQAIFESMNSTGKQLSQSDLIRNFVLMGQPPKLQDHLYLEYWRRMEEGFGQNAYVLHFDGFVRHYLTVVTGSIPRIGDVYTAYKEYMLEQLAAGRDVEAIVREMWEFSRRFVAFALGHEKRPGLAAAFKDLRELKVEVSYPFILEAYRAFDAGEIEEQEFVEIVRLVEAYVFRRSVCSVPTNSMNKTFANFKREIIPEKYLESVQVHFMSLRSYRRFPSDVEFKLHIKEHDLYNFGNRTYWLRRIENFNKKERIAVEDYTIEHIMPQNENLSSEWQRDLGENWKAIQEKWLHTLGNLTLTGYNSEYGDKPFQRKRDMPGGFKESPLFLNKGLGQVDTWNEDEIVKRAERISEHALSIWKAPLVSEELLQSYQHNDPSVKDEYSLNDHKHYSSPGIPELFLAYRTEVLALDTSITERITKHYIAYKADINFSEVVIQAKALKIYLKVDPVEISDPRGMVEDVSKIGRLGNGETLVRLSSMDDLRYVVGLTRQAFEAHLLKE